MSDIGPKPQFDAAHLRGLHPDSEAGPGRASHGSSRTDGNPDPSLVGEKGVAPIPEDASWERLSQAAQGCQACDLYRNATQTVFGEGLVGAQVMLVGEQPGDREDIEGLPFVGPAGQVLDRALADAGIDRATVYVTNAVKHFKWQPRGKRRIHQKPNAAEVAACRPWLEAEIEVVGPALIVCMGATAAQSLLGPSFRVTKRRGEVMSRLDGRRITATVHPSSILRAPDELAREHEYELFVRDLRVVACEMPG